MKKAMQLILLCTLPGVAEGQWMYLPGYDYVPDNPNLPETLGVQRPVSTRPGGPLEGFEHHSMRANAVQFTLSVPLADLQAALPPGFTAFASAPGAVTASIYLVFVLGQRSWYAGYGPMSPLSYVVVSAPAFNAALGRTEMLIVAAELPTAEGVELVNRLYGPGIARLAEIEEEIESEGVATRFRLKVKDEGLGLEVRAEATCPYPIDLRSWTDPDTRVWRWTAGKTAFAPYRQASQGDYRLVGPAEAGAEVVAKDGLLNLPGGSVRLLGIVGTVSFNRSQENFRRTLPSE